MLQVFVVILLLLFILFSLRKRSGRKRYKGVVGCDMDGKVVIITGANTGIGKEAARMFARLNAKVIIACRCLQSGRSAAEDISNSTQNSNIIVKECDLRSLKSVRNFVDDVLSTEERLDVLVCNAGIGGQFGRNLTEDNIEVQFQTNHLSHFLMVNLLTDLLKRSSPSRVVITSSSAHRFGTLDIENMIRFDKYISHPFFAYSDTKLANLLFMRELSRKLKNSAVTVNALHPGAVYTNIIKYNKVWYMKIILIFLCFLQNRSVEEGAQTIVYLSSSAEVNGVTGKYFVDCQPSNYNPTVDDRFLSKKLWDVSQQLCSLQRRFTTEDTEAAISYSRATCTRQQ
ncbi:Retinol dehydrogenase 11-like protein [Leptotrombidium deliense]|uniref:Retinol dehydrogenase 11-like protein n=1 Tax=Leptotrombidium deliense TaxID=299467 RepID=A0A443SNC3_9ACAR|nr:Retinol dehydrogenase 11-like protein [Leptotrombidium deliense]